MLYIVTDLLQGCQPSTSAGMPFKWCSANIVFKICSELSGMNYHSYSLLHSFTSWMKFTSYEAVTRLCLILASVFRLSWHSQCLVPEFPGAFSCKRIFWDHYQVSRFYRCPHFQVPWLTCSTLIFHWLFPIFYFTICTNSMLKIWAEKFANCEPKIYSVLINPS